MSFNCNNINQGCSNYATCQGNGTCACPTGYGGSNCSATLCQSSLTPNAGRLSSNGGTCSCDGGFVSPNCNVCSNDDACNPLSFTSIDASSAGARKVCNQQFTAYGEGYMFCSSDDRTFVFTRNTRDMTVRTYIYQGANHTISCISSDCQQSTETTNTWMCPTSECECATKAPCDLSNTTPASSTLNLTCIDDDCVYAQSSLGETIFLSNCQFGECVDQSAIPQDTTPQPITFVFIGILGLLLILGVCSCIFAKMSQRKRRNIKAPHSRKGAYVLWKDLRYEVVVGGFKSKLCRSVLDGVDGEAKPGEVLAVMGPSGAGKSTLVDIVGGRCKRGKLSGTLLFDGEVMKEEEMRDAVGFVDQEDTLSPFLTVKETLQFAVNLKFPESSSKHLKSQRVEEVLQILGLKHVANTKVGSSTERGISGGEKRRVSIAIEMLVSPEVLILDEPLSGLDSKSAKDIFNAMMGLARSDDRTTIIMTIHQPRSDIYHSFDKVCLVARGQIIYLGDPEEATKYFAKLGHICPEAYNPADFLLDVAHMPKFCERFSTINYASKSNSGSDDFSGNEKQSKTLSAVKQRMVKSLRSMHLHMLTMTKNRVQYTTGFMTQFEQLCRREWRYLIRDKQLFLAHLIMAIVLALFQGGLYYNSGYDSVGLQNRLGSLYFFLTIASFSSISTLAPLYRERPIFLKERANRLYGPVPWILSRLLFDLIPLRIFPSCLMACIIYWMVGLQDESGKFLKFLFIVLVYNVGMASMFMTLGAVFKNQGLSTLLASLQSLNQILFAGLFVHLSDITPVLRWLQYLTQSRFALEALVVNEADGLLMNASAGRVSIILRQSDVVAALFGFDNNAYWFDASVNAIFSVAFIIIFSLCVTTFLKERK